jgi:hypothetical protein
MGSVGNENQVVRPSPGAQTEHRGDAASVRVLRGGGDAPVAFAAGSVVPGADAFRMLRAIAFLLVFFLTERFGGFGTEGPP